MLFVIRRSWINAHSSRICYTLQAFLKYISTVASCRTEELSGDNSLNFYWLSLNQPCFWTDEGVCSCFGIKVHADAFVLFYFYCTSSTFRAVHESALEVIVHLCIRMCWFALCFSSCLFLSAVEKSFTLPLLSVAVFHFPCILYALGADPSYY